ncbi:MAG TPA: metal ABC transporter ATP-binding protein [Longimicrobiales bacterium]|nr:metal ABC transporter ATP-binding protein [Longimicrobiales bacterium]
MSENKPAILLEHVRAAYDGHLALEDVSFQVDDGRFAALIGPNGAGKSTALRLVLGLLRPESGRVEVFGHPPGRGGLIGYVPQKVVIPRGFPISVLDVAIMGRTAVLGPGRRPRAEDRERALSALEQVGLVDTAGRRFQNLSGGQQQRVLIARALCSEPRLLLLDEPTAGLDSGARARFYALVCELQHAQGLTLLCATHDLDVVGDHADKLILLDRTVRLQGTPEDVMSSGALGRAYPFPTAHVHSPDGAAT